MKSGYFSINLTAVEKLLPHLRTVSATGHNHATTIIEHNDKNIITYIISYIIVYTTSYSSSQGHLFTHFCHHFTTENGEVVGTNDLIF